MLMSSPAATALRMPFEEVVAPVMASTARDWLSMMRGISSASAEPNHSPVRLSVSETTLMSVILPSDRVTSAVRGPVRPKLGAVPV